MRNKRRVGAAAWASLLSLLALGPSPASAKTNYFRLTGGENLCKKQGLLLLDSLAECDTVAKQLYSSLSEDAKLTNSYIASDRPEGCWAKSGGPYSDPYAEFNTYAFAKDGVAGDEDGGCYDRGFTLGRCYVFCKLTAPVCQNGPNGAPCFCGADESACTAQNGLVCDAASSTCSHTTVTCNEGANSQVCMCGEWDCGAAASVCDSANDAVPCSDGVVVDTACKITDGSAPNTEDCECGTKWCRNIITFGEMSEVSFRSKRNHAQYDPGRRCYLTAPKYTNTKGMCFGYAYGSSKEGVKLLYYGDPVRQDNCTTLLTNEISPCGVCPAKTTDYCGNCPLGKFVTPELNQAMTEYTYKCESCPVGKYGGVIQVTNSDLDHLNPKGSFLTMSCALCPAGYANPNIGSTSPDACVECAPGFFNNAAQVAQALAELSLGVLVYASDGVGKCKECPPGRTSLAGSKSSESCNGLDVIDCEVGQRSIGAKCQFCNPGMYGGETTERKASCFLCPHGKYNDESGAKSSGACKPCDESATLCFASAGASSGSAKVPSSVRFPSFDSTAHELPILERSPLGAESRTSASIDTPEIEYVTQYIIMSSCAGLALVLVLVHRLLPEQIKGLDLAFAGSHYIDDGHALRMLDTRLGATCTLALVPIVGMLIVVVLGAPNKAFSQSPCWGGLCPVDIQPTTPVPGFYGGMKIILRAFAASPSAPCKGGAGGFQVGQELGAGAKGDMKLGDVESFDCKVKSTTLDTPEDTLALCDVVLSCQVSSTLKGNEAVAVDVPDAYQNFEWTVATISLDGTEETSLHYKFGVGNATSSDDSKVLRSGPGYPDGRTIPIQLEATRSVLRDLTVEESQRTEAMRGALTFIGKPGLAPDTIGAGEAASMTGQNRVYFQFNVHEAVFVAEISVKASFMSRLASVLSFLLSVLAALRVAKSVFGCLIDKYLAKQSRENIPRDVIVRLGVLEEEGGGGGGGEESRVASVQAENPLFRGNGVQMTVRGGNASAASAASADKKRIAALEAALVEIRREMQQQTSGRFEVGGARIPPMPSSSPPPQPTTADPDVEILVDEETGNRYSYNSKTGETAWL